MTLYNLSWPKKRNKDRKDDVCLSVFLMIETFMQIESKIAYYTMITNIAYLSNIISKQMTKMMPQHAIAFESNF